MSDDVAPGPPERGSPRAAVEAVIGAIAGRRGLALAFVCALLGLSYAAMIHAVGTPPRPPVDNSIEIWFLDDAPEMKAYQAFQRDFGNDEAVLVALPCDGGVFAPDALDLIAAVSSRLATVRHVRGVTSLSTVLHTGTREDGAVVVERLFHAPLPVEPAARQAAAERARTRVLGNPLYRGELVSKDERTTLLTVQLAPRDQIPDLERGERGKILADLRVAIGDALEARGRPRDAYHWGGLGVINERLNELSFRDLVVFFPISSLVIVVVLWLTFRSLPAVLLSTTTVYLASTLTLGAYFGAGRQLNLVTSILPTLVTVIGLTDSVYFITTWMQERRALEATGLTKRQALVRCIGFCALPGLFNSVTSSVGFLAFLSADMQVLRDLGLFAGLGILIAYVMSVIVCTLGLDWLDLGAKPPAAPDAAPAKDAAPEADDGLMARGLGALADFVARRYRAILIGACVLALVAGAGVLRLRVDTFTIRYFFASDPVRRDNDAIEARFGPYLPLEVVVDTSPLDSSVHDGIKRPDVLRGMVELERRTVAEEKDVGHATSFTGVVRRLNQVFAGPPGAGSDAAPIGTGDPIGYEVPTDPDVIEQELLWYDPQRADDPIVVVDAPAWRQGRITFRTTNDSAVAAREAIERLKARARETLPKGVELVPTGYVPLYVALVHYLVAGQVSSLFLTGVVVCLLLTLLFRSVRYALISLPSNVLPVALTLGFMGWVGIDLDVATVLIASIALGLAVDDTIHFVFKFKSIHEATGDTSRAVRATLVSCGEAILATSLVIALGFSVLMLASVKSVALFGVLMSVTMVGALVSELLVTPSVILAFAPARPAPTAGAEVDPARP